MEGIEILWLALLVVFLVAEAATVAMVSLWFAAGALAALVVSLFTDSFVLQIAVFLVVSVVLLALLRPFARRFAKPRYRTNVDSIVGTLGLVQEQVDNREGTGRVRLGGLDWTARSTTGEILTPGTQVRVDRVEGVKVFVTAVPVSVNP